MALRKTLFETRFSTRVGRQRFQSIIRFIQFADNTTRHEQAANDKAEPISDIWNMLNAILAAIYKPTENVTIDEKLFPLQGRSLLTTCLQSLLNMA